MIAKTEFLETLLDELESSNKRVIRRAVDALIPLTAGSPEVAVRLHHMLDDSRRKNLWSVAYVLAHVPLPSARVLETLCAALDDGDSDIRWAIALALIRLGKTDREVIAFLLRLLTQGTPTQRRMAIYCIRDLELTDCLSLEALSRSLNDSEPAVRVAAATSLKQRTDVDHRVKNRLLQLFLYDPDSRVRNAAAISLAHFGSPSDEFLSALEKAIQGADTRLSKAATAALRALKHKGPISHGDE